MVEHITLSFSAALARYRRAFTDSGLFPHSPSNIESSLRWALKSGDIKSVKISGRWVVNAASLETECVALEARYRQHLQRIEWESRAQLLVADLLDQAMKGEGRTCSWPFDEIGELSSKKDIDGLWKALNKIRKRLQHTRSKDTKAWNELVRLKRPLRLI